MQGLYFWPESPALSIAALWGLSVLVLWAAREPMLQLLRGLTRNLESGFKAMAGWCESTARGVQERSRAALDAASELELQGRISREFQRIDASFSEKLGRYAELHRKLDDLVQKLDADYDQCGSSPPQVPGWAAAVEAVSAIPANSDPSVHKVLEGIRESLEDAGKRALHEFREDSSKRHKILGRMRPDWRGVKALCARMVDAIGKALQTSRKLERYVDEYEKIVKGREAAAHATSYSAGKPFLISLLVIGIALGGAFINFQLIALPMSELVPAGARLGGVPVSTVSALVLVLMETAVGIFLMDMLGITDLFPKLASIAPSRRRLILGVSLMGLFFLSGVEASLAVLREQIVAANAALELALGGQAAAAVAMPVDSKIPVIGQAALGFVLPWILAMVAIPLEMLLDSGRHVVSAATVLLLQALGNLVRFLGGALTSVNSALPSIYDVYVAIPLRIERLVRGREEPIATGSRPRRATSAGVA